MYSFALQGSSQISGFLLVILCGIFSLCLPFFLSHCFHIMPRSTKNSQATLQSDRNLPCLLGENSMPVSSTLPPGALNSSVAVNPSSQLSPDFLATMVHAVKVALAAEQVFVPSLALPSLPVQGALSIMNSSADFFASDPFPFAVHCQHAALVPG